MAFASVTTKLTAAWNATEISQVLTGGAGTGDLIFTGDLSLGSAHIVQTSGTAITDIKLKVANDGLVDTSAIPALKNGVQLGPTIAAANLPTVADLMTGSIINAALTTLSNVGQTPYKYVQFTTTGGDATSIITISIILVGQRQ